MIRSRGTGSNDYLGGEVLMGRRYLLTYSFSVSRGRPSALTSLCPWSPTQSLAKVGRWRWEGGLPYTLQAYASSKWSACEAPAGAKARRV